MSDTIFAKIIAGEIPSEKLYEDDHCIVINDIAPKAPVHMLVIPKKPIAKLSQAGNTDQELLGHLLLVANRIAVQRGIDSAYRVVINNGAGAGQTVFHLHIHVMGGHTFSEADL